MARSQNDKAIEQYVFGKMPKKVKTARERALFELWHGPSGSGGGWEKNRDIVEDWWSENMGDDLIVDDAGNVVTKYEWEKFLREIGDERHDEALQEAIDDGLDTEEEVYRNGDYATEAEHYAREQASAYVDGAMETATEYDSGDVKQLILTREWV